MYCFQFDINVIYHFILRQIFDKPPTFSEWTFMAQAVASYSIEYLRLL